MRTVAIIQARMGSARLPGKSLANISGQSLLAHIVDRVRASRCVQHIVVATTEQSEDDPIEALASLKAAACFRGSADDVLDRYYQAARQSGADIVVRITADDPFKDPDVLDLVTDSLAGDATLDYASNTIRPTFPEGLDVEAFRFAALQRAWTEAKLPSEREHVTPYLWKHPERFRIRNISHSEDLSHLRWTLDYPEDLEFTRAVYSRLYDGRIFRMSDILRLLGQNPQLGCINQGIERNAGYQKSLREENI